MNVNCFKRKFIETNTNISSISDYKKIKHSKTNENNMLNISLHNSISFIENKEELYGQFVSTDNLYYHNNSSEDDKIIFQISPNKRFEKKY